MSYGYQTFLHVDGNKYDVKAASYSFGKSIDQDGAVASPIEGGVIFLSLADLPKTPVLQWAIDHRSYKKGLIEVIGNDNESSMINEEIAFENAACICLKLMYEREHSGYFTTLLTISPHRIKVGRNGSKVTKPWTLDEPEEEAPVDAKEELKELFAPEDITINGILTIKEKEYEIQTFETEFIQSDDYKGQPIHEVKGGLISITLTQVSDKILNDWIFEKDISYAGSITFAPYSRSASVPLKIDFEKGRCISYDKTLGINAGIRLNLLITAEKITVNDEIPHTNTAKRY